MDAIAGPCALAGTAGIHPHLFLCHHESEARRRRWAAPWEFAGKGLEILPRQTLEALSLITLEGLLARVRTITDVLY